MGKAMGNRFEVSIAAAMEQESGRVDSRGAHEGAIFKLQVNCAGMSEISVTTKPMQPRSTATTTVKGTITTRKEPIFHR